LKEKLIKIGVRRSVVVCSKTMGEVRLGDNKIRTSLARRDDVSGFGAQNPLCRGIGIAKIHLQRQFQPQQARHPVG